MPTLNRSTLCPRFSNKKNKLILFSSFRTGFSLMDSCNWFHLKSFPEGKYMFKVSKTTIISLHNKRHWLLMSSNSWSMNWISASSPEQQLSFRICQFAWLETLLQKQRWEKGGGVGINLRDFITYKIINNIICLDDTLEHLCVEVKGKNK